MKWLGIGLVIAFLVGPIAYQRADEPATLPTPAARTPDQRQTEAPVKLPPVDFLKVDSKAWSKWLDERIDVSGSNVPLKNLLAAEFGPADFAVEDEKALETPISFDFRDTSRRAALWRISQRYGFAIQWKQKNEPRVFLGLSEAEHREHQVGGVTLPAVTQVMRSDYKTYQDRKQRGQVTKQEVIDGILYYAIDVDRDLHIGNATAHVNEVQRYKTAVPTEKAGVEEK